MVRCKIIRCRNINRKLKYTTYKIKLMKLKTLFYGALAMVAVWGCQETLPPIPDYLYVDKDEVQADPTGGAVTFAITTNVDTWTLTSDNESWAPASPTEGVGGEAVKVTINVPFNDTGADRTAKITVNAGKFTDEVIITQKMYVEPEPVPEEDTEPAWNLVDNNTFDPSGWEHSFWVGTTVGVSADGEGAGGAGVALKFTNTNNDPGAELYYKLPKVNWKAGQTYIIKFDIKTEVAATVEYFFQKRGDQSWTRYGSNTVETTAGEWVSAYGEVAITQEFIDLAPDYFTFVLGSASGVTLLDNVTIIKKVEQPIYVTDGGFDAGVNAGWAAFNGPAPVWNQAEGNTAPGCMEGVNAAGGNAWDLQYAYNFATPFAAGTTLTIEFYIKCKEGTGTIRCTTTGSAPMYQGDVEVSTEWTKVVWEPRLGAETPGFTIDMGYVANTYYIDDVVVTAL